MVISHLIHGVEGPQAACPLTCRRTPGLSSVLASVCLDGEWVQISTLLIMLSGAMEEGPRLGRALVPGPRGQGLSQAPLWVDAEGAALSVH